MTVLADDGERGVVTVEPHPCGHRKTLVGPYHRCCRVRRAGQSIQRQPTTGVTARGECRARLSGAVWLLPEKSAAVERDVLSNAHAAAGDDASSWSASLTVSSAELIASHDMGHTCPPSRPEPSRTDPDQPGPAPRSDGSKVLAWAAEQTELEPLTQHGRRAAVTPSGPTVVLAPTPRRHAHGQRPSFTRPADSAAGCHVEAVVTVT